MAARAVSGMLVLVCVVSGQVCKPAAQSNTSTKDDPKVEEARALLREFLKLNARGLVESPKARELLVGEAAERWATPSIGPMDKEPDKILLIDGAHAVGRVLSRRPTRVVDCYLYMERREDGWKIFAMRELSLTGISEMALVDLRSRPILTEDERFALNQIQLELSSDQELKLWFAKSRESLERLVELALTKLGDKRDYVKYDDDSEPEVSAALQKLFVNSIDLKPHGNIEVVFGGILDNTVGFLFSANNTPPQIAPNSYIWVERVAEKWYLFRTT